ncbi:hypothetical protein U879_04220 [Defluviimonas sp. 20V17]|uniref:DUF934 domain-containing protein n=1 Tax=Allgaiera indica TaxID=765699 RepID=A0AAN5A1J0_9RHOB|nr:DUF934 domain-containing protein [Allgaiera indica]KDB04952.1 hypothetical protein U879_04220 [Defluviimonas sp. 20V17]GHE05730.1 hypothetical protein GCM10008024_37640 [Allgaiera indica]SDX76791.1 protein of unknown function [Allgaiera indica]
MTVLVTDRGFGPADPPPGEVLDLGPADPLEPLAGRLAALSLIRITFPTAGDGRGFTLAQRLRDMGYRGALWAAGAIIADQYAMARRAGFDAAEIPDAMAERQPQDQWLYRADWRAHDPRQRLRSAV